MTALEVRHLGLVVGFLAITSRYMVSPLLAGVLGCLADGIAVSRVGLRLGRPRRLLGAVAVSLPLVALALFVSLLVPGVGFDPSVDPVPGIGLTPGAVGVLAALVVVLARRSTRSSPSARSSGGGAHCSGCSRCSGSGGPRPPRSPSLGRRH